MLAVCMTFAGLAARDVSLFPGAKKVMVILAPKMCNVPAARPSPCVEGVLCGLQLPDRRHVARELRDIHEKTFRQLVEAYLQAGSESISLPSNLLLMYMAVT